MDYKTLRQVCEICHVTRRAVQGYEVANLVHPSCKSDRGYNLYDEKMIQQIQRIKQLQNFGFTLKEIQDIDEENLKELLLEKEKCIDEQLLQMKDNKRQIRKWINSL